MLVSAKRLARSQSGPITSFRPIYFWCWGRAQAHSFVAKERREFGRDVAARTVAWTADQTFGLG